MIWLTGGAGLLGRHVAVELERAALPFWSSDREVDIGSLEALREFAAGKDIRWVVNCASYTAVDRAENERGEAFRVNASGTQNIASIAEACGARIVHFSTDYVFDGSAHRPYREDDEPRPLNVYGESKWEGEKLLQRESGRFFLFRISWLYGLWGSHFVGTMLRLLAERPEVRVVSDQVGAPTYAGALAVKLVQKLILEDSRRFGTYHYSDGGSVSWYDYAVEIRRQAEARGLVPRPAILTPIPTNAYASVAVRPAWSVFDRRKVAADLGFPIDDWRDNLERCFDALAGAK